MYIFLFSNIFLCLHIFNECSLKFSKFSFCLLRIKLYFIKCTTQTRAALFTANELTGSLNMDKLISTHILSHWLTHKAAENVDIFHLHQF